MNRYQEIAEKYAQTATQLQEHEEEYKGKKKGNIYEKRKNQLIAKGMDLQRKAKAIGTVGNICHVRGKRSRPHMKNPKILVQERFNLYFTNVSEEEASALVGLHVKNVVQYTITFMRPGIIITTS